MPAEVSFSSLVGKARIKHVSTGPPWEDDDYYKHETIKASYLVPDTFNPDNVVGRHDRVCIVIRREEFAAHGIYDHARKNGASKQVAREEEAFAMRRTIEQLRKWYDSGWASWDVCVEFLEFHSSVEVTCEAGDQYMLDVVKDLATEVAGQLEKVGFTVKGKLDPQSRDSKRFKLHLKVSRNLGFADIYDYRRWLLSGPVK